MSRIEKAFWFFACFIAGSVLFISFFGVALGMSAKLIFQANNWLEILFSLCSFLPLASSCILLTRVLVESLLEVCRDILSGR